MYYNMLSYTKPPVAGLWMTARLQGAVKSVDVAAGCPREVRESLGCGIFGEEGGECSPKVL